MPRARNPIQTARAAQPHGAATAPAGRALARRTPPTTPQIRCGAKTRNGRTCRRVAGERTPHLGQGRCYLHGGLTPIKHGRYSSIKRERIRDLIEQYEAELDPLDVFPELAALRALFQDYIERYDETTEALLAWHLSWQLTKRPLPEEKVMAFEAVVEEWENSLAELGELATDRQRADAESARAFIQLLRGGDLETKPRQVLDLSDAYRILAEIGKLVERVERSRSANAISRPELNRIMQEMWRAVEARLTDGPLKTAIRDDWLRIAL